MTPDVLCCLYCQVTFVPFCTCVGLVCTVPPAAGFISHSVSLPLIAAMMMSLHTVAPAMYFAVRMSVRSPRCYEA